MSRALCGGRFHSSFEYRRVIGKPATRKYLLVEACRVQKIWAAAVNAIFMLQEVIQLQDSPSIRPVRFMLLRFM